MRLSSVLFASALALVACRSSNTNPGTDGSNNGGKDGSGSNNDGSVTIQQVQSDMMPVNTPVTLKSVVVTAIDSFGAKTGAFWVEEPEGGPFSGVQVFNAAVADVAMLSVGDIINLTGAQKAEFALMTDTSGLTDTELEPIAGGAITITKTGTGAVPAPVVVDALAIGQMSGSAARDAQWEMYEGVLITVNHVSALNAPKEVGSADNTLDKFSITGTAVVESSLAALPGATGGSGSNAGVGTIVRGDCLDSVTGVIDYFFTYNLLPRSTDDIVTGGTGCPAPEQSVAGDGTVCTDGLDNDGNGFSDCADLGCEVGSDAWLDPTNCNAATESVCGCSTNEPAGQGAATVSSNAKPGPVILRNLVVSAVGAKGFWVQDALTAAQGHGSFVFTSAAPPADVTIGATVTQVQGLAGPFVANGAPTGAVALNEVSNPTVSTATGSGVIVPISNATGAQISSVPNGGPFAGTVVSLKNIKVVTAPVNGAGKMTVTDGTTQFTVSDFAFAGGAGGYKQGATTATTAVGTCYANLTGVMDMDTKAQVRTLNPRQLTDMVSVGGTCN